VARAGRSRRRSRRSPPSRGKAIVGKLDVDENPMTAGRYGVMSIPTLLVFKNGQPVDQLVGAADKAHLKSLIDRHL
jgi:thioredoxin 1